MVLRRRRDWQAREPISVNEAGSFRSTSPHKRKQWRRRATHKQAVQTPNLSPPSSHWTCRDQPNIGHRSRTTTGFSEDVKTPDPLEMAGILAWFWNERFWLPHNVTWADLKNTDESTFPQAEDLYLACPLAFCMFMIRLVFERYVQCHYQHHHLYPCAEPWRCRASSSAESDGTGFS